ncbi:MAG: metallophosphoesterase [Lunatimonas sp.]|uniref:metallophosphoesterase family protein n=1 Tax=Lunatimonas sp. TaxID=2060141 RepID=UPI00263B9234|nr:metallophosphoesterase [Lunatimonas sp.]MCC5935748.1 metallophosphoesterase [Lunatimonas sp.]
MMRFPLYVLFGLWLQLPVSGSLVHAQSTSTPQERFSFAFLTDIHLQPERRAPIGFQMAIDKVNELNPDFVISGGDQVYDVMRGNQTRADSLFSLYVEMCKGFNMPIYHTVGNHDLFAIYPESPETEGHPDYKLGMFERYLGRPYYSFGHKGWHFIVLNSLDVTEEKRYKASVDQAQIEWLKEDLAKLDGTTPVVVVTHIPLVTARGIVTGNPAGNSVTNSAEIISLFEDHNLKLILQGHIHWKEHGQVNDRFQYLTGGSIAGNGWKGRRHDTKEGFVLLHVEGDDFRWEYIDHGWEADRLRFGVEE